MHDELGLGRHRILPRPSSPRTRADPAAASGANRLAGRGGAATCTAAAHRAAARAGCKGGGGGGGNRAAFGASRLTGTDEARRAGQTCAGRPERPSPGLRLSVTQTGFGGATRDGRRHGHRTALRRAHPEL